MPRIKITLRQALLASIAYVVLWQACFWGLTPERFSAVVAFAVKVLGTGPLSNLFVSLLGGFVGWAGWAIFFCLGLGWTVWGIERLAQKYEQRRVTAELSLGGDHVDDVLGSVGGDVCRSRKRTSNPFDLAAWYYGTSGQRLKQSFLALDVYVILFVLFYFAVNMGPKASAYEDFESPAGGGQEMAAAPKQLKKVVKKKYIINPNSNVKMGVPPDDPVKQELEKETTKDYVKGQGADGGAVGRGEGKDGGFGNGTFKGKIRFVRLQHSDDPRNPTDDGIWNRNFGTGGDSSILTEFGARTGFSKSKIAEATEVIQFEQLAGLDPKKAPPLLFIAGVSRFSLTNREKSILRDYLLERNGMILFDNLGGPGVGGQFKSLMTEIIGAPPVEIQYDEKMHRAPTPVEHFYVVVGNDGTAPKGWQVNGRWVVYYHPGALSDAWRDDHAGVADKAIIDMCYQLGVNIMVYAYTERDKWLQPSK